MKIKDFKDLDASSIIQDDADKLGAIYESTQVQKTSTVNKPTNLHNMKNQKRQTIRESVYDRSSGAQEVSDDVLEQVEREYEEYLRNKNKLKNRDVRESVKPQRKPQPKSASIFDRYYSEIFENTGLEDDLSTDLEDIEDIEDVDDIEDSSDDVGAQLQSIIDTVTVLADTLGYDLQTGEEELESDVEDIEDIEGEFEITDDGEDIEGEFDLSRESANVEMADEPLRGKDRGNLRGKKNIVKNAVKVVKRTPSTGRFVYDPEPREFRGNIAALQGKKNKVPGSETLFRPGSSAFEN